MAIDPQIQTLLDSLSARNMLPLIRGSAIETRSHYKALSMARRGDRYVPEQVGAVRNTQVTGPGGNIPVRVYTPVGDRGRVLTYLHGGGWVVGDLDTHDPVCRRIANALGTVVVSVDYRLAPEHPFPAPIDDTMAALNWVATTFPERAHIVGGDSAGGSLAAGAALLARNRGGPVLVAQLLLYPSTDPSLSRPAMTDNAEGYFLTKAAMAWFFDQYLSNSDDAARPEVDLLNAPDLTGLPPALIATAEFDPLRDDGTGYAKRLAAAGVQAHHIPGPGLIHGYFGFLGAVDLADAQVDKVLTAFATMLEEQR